MKSGKAHTPRNVHAKTFPFMKIAEGFFDRRQDRGEIPQAIGIGGKASKANRQVHPLVNVAMGRRGGLLEPQ